MTKTIALPLILAATLGLAACSPKTEASADNTVDAAAADINVATDEAVTDVNAAAADAAAATGNAVDATATAAADATNATDANTAVENVTHDKE